MTTDMMFGELDLEEQINELKKENNELREIITEQTIRAYYQDEHIKSVNAFLVSKDLAVEYLKWKGDD